MSKRGIFFLLNWRHYLFAFLILSSAGAMYFFFREEPAEPPSTPVQATESQVPIVTGDETLDDATKELLDIESELRDKATLIYKTKNKLMDTAKRLEELVRKVRNIRSENILNNTSAWYAVWDIARNWADKSERLREAEAELHAQEDEAYFLREAIDSLSADMERLRREAQNKRTQIKDLRNTNRDLVSADWFDTQEIHDFIEKRLLTYSAPNRLPPFRMPVHGEITSEFGFRYHPIDGEYKYHSGTDIAVDTGTPVHASNHGIVILSEWYSGFGNAIILFHGNGTYTLYGHNSELLAKEGDIVKQGDVVALAGSTGYSTGPHVHFSMWIEDVLVDPMVHVIDA